MRRFAIGLLLAALLLGTAPAAHAQEDTAVCEGWAAQQAMPLLQQSLAITPSGAPPYGPAGWNVFVGPFGAGPYGVAALGGPPGQLRERGPLGPGPTANALAPALLAPSPPATAPSPAALATLLGRGQNLAGAQALFALLAGAGQGPNGGAVQALIAQLGPARPPTAAPCCRCCSSSWRTARGRTVRSRRRCWRNWPWARRTRGRRVAAPAGPVGRERPGG